MAIDTEFDIKSEMDKFLLGTKFISELNLDQILEVINVADTIGPFIDPTKYSDMLWRKGNMHDMAKMVQLAKPLVAEFKKLAVELGV